MQLRSSVAVALFFAATAHASPPLPGPGAASRVVVYSDDDATTVVTTAVRATVPVGEVGAVRAGWIADVVTSASVDVVTAATRPVHERRDELSAGVDLRAGDALVSLDAAHSAENDYGSNRLSLSGSTDLAGNATTLGARASILFAAVGRAGDDAFQESLTVYALGVSVAQVVDARTLVSLAASLEVDRGYQASPYRFVTLADGSAAPEALPEGRARLALTVRLRRALSPSTVAALDERLYGDDWGLSASSTTARLVFTLASGLDLELRNRFHVQSSVAFWQARYDRRRRSMTADRELSALVDDFAGPALVYEAYDLGPFDTLRLDLRAEAFAFRFLPADRISGRLGAQLGIGLEAEL